MLKITIVTGNFNFKAYSLLTADYRKLQIASYGVVHVDKHRLNVLPGFHPSSPRVRNHLIYSGFYCEIFFQTKHLKQHYMFADKYRQCITKIWKNTQHVQDKKRKRIRHAPFLGEWVINSPSAWWSVKNTKNSSHNTPHNPISIPIHYSTWCVIIDNDYSKFLIINPTYFAQ